MRNLHRNRDFHGSEAKIWAGAKWNRGHVRAEQQNNVQGRRYESDDGPATHDGKLSGLGALGRAHEIYGGATRRRPTGFHDPGSFKLKLVRLLRRTSEEFESTLSFPSSLGRRWDSEKFTGREEQLEMLEKLIQQGSRAPAGVPRDLQGDRRGPG